MHDVEKINPYHQQGAKGPAVEKMFDSIAPAYDLMNNAMSLGLHRHWRNKALRMLDIQPHQHILDVATGTGDVAFKIYDTYHPAHITGIDLSQGMLDVARRKLASRTDDARTHITFDKADALHLPYPDNTFHAVTVAYGVRNFEHLQQGLQSMTRVLKPGGMLCIVELTEPRNPLVRALYRIYAHHLIPAVGRCISGDSDAYTYLPHSIAAAPQRDSLTHMMQQCGLTDTAWHGMTPGVACIYTGRKPI